MTENATSCYECGTPLTEGEGMLVDIDFCVFPPSDAPEGSKEVIETRPTLLCKVCGPEFAAGRQ